MSTQLVGRSRLAATAQRSGPPTRRSSAAGRPAPRLRRQIARSHEQDASGAESLGAFPGEDAPGTGARHFPSPWQKADQQERRKPAESFDMRSASEVAEIFDSFQRAGQRVDRVQDPHGAPAGVVAGRFADSGPTTGRRTRPDVMIDRDLRDTERTAEQWELKTAEEVASQFASLPGTANHAVTSSMTDDAEA